LESAVAGITSAAISTAIAFYLTKNPITAIATYCLICLPSIFVGWLADNIMKEKLKGGKKL